MSPVHPIKIEMPRREGSYAEECRIREAQLREARRLRGRALRRWCLALWRLASTPRLPWDIADTTPTAENDAPRP